MFLNKNTTVASDGVVVAGASSSQIVTSSKTNPKIEETGMSSSRSATPGVVVQHNDTGGSDPSHGIRLIHGSMGSNSEAV